MFDAKDSVPMGGIVGGEQIAPAPSYFPRAGNTVDSLRPVNGHVKSSEKLVTEGLTTKPEPVEVKEEVRSVPLEIATLPTELLTTKEVTLATTFESVEEVLPADPGHAEAWATWTAIVDLKKTIATLKEDFNDSMSEVANMLLDLQTANVNLEERIAKYNQRGGHRI